MKEYYSLDLIIMILSKQLIVQYGRSAWNFKGCFIFCVPWTFPYFLICFPSFFLSPELFCSVIRVWLVFHLWSSFSSCNLLPIKSPSQHGLLKSGGFTIWGRLSSLLLLLIHSSNDQQGWTWWQNLKNERMFWAKIKISFWRVPMPYCRNYKKPHQRILTQESIASRPSSWNIIQKLSSLE